MQALLQAAILLIGSQSSLQAIASQAQSLPPQPDQSLIQCHDKQWEFDSLVNVAGAQTSKQLEPYVLALIGDARAEGYPITITSGYRDCELQGSLRSQACGTGEYNLYQRPIVECLPPTEPAGHSLHNEGLAVDFACTGYGFFEYSPCYSWLQKNGAKYLLKEHELEAWHWSTTGK